MRTIAQAQADQIIANHEVWLSSGGLAGERGDLSYCHLSDLNLTRKNLSQMQMYSSKFENCDFSQSILNYGDLTQSSFNGSTLIDCKLANVQAKNASFQNADLSHSILDDGIFNAANFRYANLQETFFWNTNVSYADFTEADLLGADLRGANFSMARLVLTNLTEVALDLTTNFRGIDLAGATLNGVHPLFLIRSMVLSEV